DVTNLLDKERIIGKLESLLSMRLQAKQFEPALDRALRNAGVSSHLAHRPMRGVRRRALQRCVNHLSHSFIFEASGPARTQLIVQTLKSLLQVAAPPFTHRKVSEAHAFGDGCVRFSLSAGEH